MKWIKLLLSIAILVAISFGVNVLSQSSHGKFDPRIAYFILGWIATGLIGVIVFICRISGFVNNKESFGYIFLGCADFLIGTLGLSEILLRNAWNQYLAASLLFGTMMLGVFFLLDTFRVKLPGLESNTKKFDSYH